MGCHIDCLSTDNLQNRRFFFSFFSAMVSAGQTRAGKKKKISSNPRSTPLPKKKSFVIALLSSSVTRIRASLALAFVRLKKQKNYTCSEG